MITMSLCRYGFRCFHVKTYMTQEIIAVANQKGGVGKTTTAINLACALASRGQEILLVDLDPQGNTTSGLGFDKSNSLLTIYPVLMGQNKIQEAIKPTNMEFLDIVCSNTDLIGAEIELVSALARETRLKQALHDVSDLYRFVIVDCPPSLGLLTINAVAASNKVILPIQSEYYALEGLAGFTSAVNKIKSALNPGLEIEGVVMTMFDTRISLGHQVKSEVEKFFKGSFFKTCIPRNIRLAEAPSFGKSIFDYAPASKGAEAYLALADEVLSKRGFYPMVGVES